MYPEAVPCQVLGENSYRNYAWVAQIYGPQSSMVLITLRVDAAK